MRRKSCNTTAAANSKTSISFLLLYRPFLPCSSTYGRDERRRRKVYRFQEFRSWRCIGVAVFSCMVVRLLWASISSLSIAMGYSLSFFLIPRGKLDLWPLMLFEVLMSDRLYAISYCSSDARASQSNKWFMVKRKIFYTVSSLVWGRKR